MNLVKKLDAYKTRLTSSKSSGPYYDVSSKKVFDFFNDALYNPVFHVVAHKGLVLLIDLQGIEKEKIYKDLLKKGFKEIDISGSILRIPNVIIEDLQKHGLKMDDEFLVLVEGNFALGKYDEKVIPPYAIKNIIIMQGEVLSPYKERQKIIEMARMLKNEIVLEVDDIPPGLLFEKGVNVKFPEEKIEELINRLELLSEYEIIKKGTKIKYQNNEFESNVSCYWIPYKGDLFIFNPTNTETRIKLNGKDYISFMNGFLFIDERYDERKLRESRERYNIITKELTEDEVLEYLENMLRQNRAPEKGSSYDPISDSYYKETVILIYPDEEITLPRSYYHSDPTIENIIYPSLKEMLINFIKQKGIPTKVKFEYYSSLTIYRSEYNEETRKDFTGYASGERVMDLLKKYEHDIDNDINKAPSL